jgi:hypothetical protein
MPWNRSDLEAGRLVWLLNLTIRGKLYRFSTDVLNVSNADASEGPSSLQYTAGLEFLEYADTSRDIGTATGELSLHIVGEDYGNRQIILSGFLDSPSYGAVNEPVSFTLQESDHLDPLQFPPAQSVIDQTSWPFTTVSGNRLNIDDSARGQHYPWVFGQPGTHPPLAWWGQTKALLDATPAMLVRIDETAEDNATNACKFVIAGHETWSDPVLRLVECASRADCDA